MGGALRVMHTNRAIVVLKPGRKSNVVSEMGDDIHQQFWRFSVPWRPMVAPLGRRPLVFSCVRNVSVPNLHRSPRIPGLLSLRPKISRIIVFRI